MLFPAGYTVKMQYIKYPYNYSWAVRSGKNKIFCGGSMSNQSGSQSGNQKSWSDNPAIVTITVIAALVAIIAFLFGTGELSDLMNWFTQRQLVGTWQDQQGGTITFYDDGTVVTQSGLLIISGYYEVIDNKQLRIENRGLFAIAGPQVYRFEISGKKMTFVDQFGITTFLTKVR